MGQMVDIQTTFGGGELSPRLEGRVDVNKYHDGCRRLENFTVHIHGGADRRPGLRFVAPAKDHATAARLIPFVFSEGQAYVLEFGQGHIRFFYQGGQLLSDGQPYEIASPYASDDLAQLKFTQSADVMYLAHPGHEPRMLTRMGHTNWTLTPVAFTSRPAQWTTGNYPGTVGFFEQRLWWAGTVKEPQTLWASRSGYYHDMSAGPEDDDALCYTIASDRVNRVLWLLPHRKLLVGTMGGEWTAGASSTAQPMTPINAKFDRQSTHGSATNGQAILLNHAALFWGVHGRKLRQFAYRYDSDGYEGLDLTLLAEHVTKGGVWDFAHAQDPDSIIWAVRADGVLLGCTYYPVEEVVAWHRHVTEGAFESVAVIPFDGSDQVWLLVRRQIDGQWRRYIEVMRPWDGQDIGDAFFVDSGLSYQGEPTSVLTGLEHLEGKTVRILADGGPHPERVVSGGRVELQTPASQAHVGLGYVSLLETMRMEANAGQGTIQGQFKRIPRAVLRLHATVGGEVGASVASLTPLLFRTVADPMDQPEPPFSGDKEVTLGGGYERDGRIVVRQDQPLPMTILAIMPVLEIDAK